jgi:hypothetical protein
MDNTKRRATMSLVSVVVVCSPVLVSCCTALPTPPVTLTPTVVSTATSTILPPSPMSVPVPVRGGVVESPMPDYYAPHPALRQITPPIESEWHRYALQWEDNDTLRYLVDEERCCESKCVTNTWAIYVFTGVTRVTTETICTQDATPTPELPRPADLNAAEVFSQLPSPDGSTVLIITRATAPRAALPKLGVREEKPEYPILHGWLARTDGSGLRPVFYTVERFSFLWTPDSRYIVAVGDICYGGDMPDFIIAMGLFSIDVDNLSIHTIKSDYIGGCEGSIAFQISPDSRHLIYEPGIVTTLDGVVQVHVCGEGEQARSYGWSQDGQDVYAACMRDSTESDVLRRYDTGAVALFYHVHS